MMLGKLLAHSVSPSPFCERGHCQPPRREEAARGKGVVGQLPDSATKQAGHPLTLAFQMNNEYLFLVCEYPTCCVGHTYTPDRVVCETQFNWASCIWSAPQSPRE